MLYLACMLPRDHSSTGHLPRPLLCRKAHMSSKKLLEQCMKLEKLWGHSLTTTLPLHADNWYNKLTDLIEKQQTAPSWMSDTKVGHCFSKSRINYNRNY